MSRSKAKGSRIEREIVELHLDLGHKAERMPLSGSLGGKYAGDVLLDIGVQLRGEVKARKNGEGFAVLEKWLGEQHLLFLRKDKSKPIVTMRWETYAMFLRVVKLLHSKAATVEIASVLCLPTPERKPSPPRAPRPPRKPAT